jgi:uncharacterized protein with HEPN domain
MSRSTLDRLRDIIHSAELVLGHAKGLDAAALQRNALQRDAAVFRIMVVGEAVNHLPIEVLALAPEVRWEQARGMRNHLAHGYWQIDHDVIANTVRMDIPLLLDVTRRLLAIVERAEQ